MTREEAIKMLNSFLELSYFDITKDALTMAIEALREEPKKTAKWFEYGVFRLECSNCNCKAMRAYNYCPQCGAEMDGVEL